MARKQKSEKELVVSSAAAAAPRRKSVTATRKHFTNQADVPAAAPVEIPPTQPAPLAASPAPTFEAISALAYSFWVDRGYQGGSQEEDWLRAEQELRNAVAAKA